MRIVVLCLLGALLIASSLAFDLGSVRGAIECHACYYVLSEVEGFVSENATTVEIEQQLDELICSKLGSTAQSFCDAIVSFLPEIISLIDQGASAGELCLSAKLCTKLPNSGVDGQPLPAFTIDLDLPPSQRWNLIATYPAYANLIKTVWAELQNFLSSDFLASINVIGNDAWSRLAPVYQEEIQGAATALDIPVSVGTLLNLLYDLTDGCTSVVAMAPNGSILHARNLDFGSGMDDTELLRELSGMFTYTRGGQPLFISMGFPFFSGVITGFKPGAFGVSLNERFLPKGPLDRLTTAIDFLLHNDASPPTFLARLVMENTTNYFMALERLADKMLIDDVYYILSGKSMRGCGEKELCGPNQGTVITRSRDNATDVWHVSPPDPWFILETNYDHWLPAPWYDDRADAGNAAMSAIGQNAITLPKMYKALSVKPVLNLKTIMTVLMSADFNTYSATLRSCSDPCPF